MPSTNPTMEDFNALDARVAVLEGDVPIPPDPPDPPVEATPKAKLFVLFDAIKGKSWLVGQQCHNDLAEHTYDKSKGVNNALLITDPWMDNVGGHGHEPNTKGLISHARSGGVVGMSAALPNPITWGGAGDKSQINAAQMITPGTAQHSAFLAVADTVAGFLQPLEDAGIAYLHRAMLEADMGAFWYNVQDMFSAEQYIQLFRIYVDRLRSHGLHNMVMVFATNGNRVDHYPGDDHTDVVGFDSYTDNPAQHEAHYNALKAKAPSKYIAFTEFGSGTWSAGNPNFNCQTLVDAIWNKMRDCVYCMAWTGSAQGGWAWGYYQNRGVLTAPKALQWGQLPAQQQAPSTASLQSVEARQRHGDGLEIAMSFADRLEAREWLVWLADRIRLNSASTQG